MKRIFELVMVGSAALSAVASPGCASLSRSVGLDRRGAAAADDASLRAEELPKGQTVQVCLATAEQLAQQRHAHEAIQLYERARALDPHATDYPRRLAPLYDLQGDLPRAAAEFQAALATAPRDPDLLNDYACLLQRQSNLPEAERLLRAALNHNPSHTRAQVNLAIVLERQGRTQEAFEAFIPAVGPAAAHYNIGMLLAKRGQHDEARRAIHQALAIDPQLSQAQMAMAYLAKQH